MRICIVGSTAGGAFKEFYKIVTDCNRSKIEFVVITDRRCGLEDFCVEQGIKVSRVVETNNQIFSREAKKYLDDIGGVDFILLFYSRLITEDLFKYYRCFNIHPSLLPAFKGMNAIEQLYRSKSRFLGATLHLVDNTIDEGPIIAQTVMPLTKAENLQRLNKYSFIQKVYLSLLAVEMVETESIRVSLEDNLVVYSKPLVTTDRCSPSITSKQYIESLKRLESLEQVEVVF